MFYKKFIFFFSFFFLLSETFVKRFCWFLFTVLFSVSVRFFFSHCYTVLSHQLFLIPVFCCLERIKKKVLFFFFAYIQLSNCSFLNLNDICATTDDAGWFFTNTHIQFGPPNQLVTSIRSEIGVQKFQKKKEIFFINY